MPPSKKGEEVHPLLFSKEGERLSRVTGKKEEKRRLREKIATPLLLDEREDGHTPSLEKKGKDDRSLPL